MLSVSHHHYRGLLVEICGRKAQVHSLAKSLLVPQAANALQPAGRWVHIRVPTEKRQRKRVVGIGERWQ